MTPYFSILRTHQLLRRFSRNSLPTPIRTMTVEVNGSSWPGVSLSSLPKSNVFTSNLPPDQKFPTPQSSHKAPRDQLGPRAVSKALYTYVRPERTEQPQILGVSNRAMRDIGLADGEEKDEEFRQLTGGNKMFWNEQTEEGIYPWAQCYGGMKCYKQRISVD